MNAEDRYDSLLRYYAEKAGLDWRYAKAQMLQESAANPTAVSPVGARGLFQFLGRTWREWWDGTPGIQAEPPAGSIDNPELQIQRRCDYMRWLLRELGGDLVRATAAYNWGIGNLRVAERRYGPLWLTHAPKETRDYVARIERRFTDFQASQIA